jgi:murein L,D-transpeptidase YafK
MSSDGGSKRRPRRRVIIALAAACAVIGLATGFAVLHWTSGSGTGRTRSDFAKSMMPAAQVARPDVGPDEVLVVVNKSERRLKVFRGEKEVQSFPVVLGPKSQGDKQRQGDGQTPEGTFYVCEKNEKSKFYLFVGLSYPNQEDAERGLRDGLITAEEHDAIVQAIADHKKPPWYTKLGGEIGLHGGGTAWDWTEGCVGLDNGDMRELYALMPMGTVVVIEP